MRTSARRIAIVLAAVGSAVVLVTGVASAHVTAQAPGATQGGFGEVTFRVPTESDTASTVSLSVQVPQNPPISSVSVKPVPGWTATTKTTHLAQPVKTDDGDTVSDVVSQVTWTANPGQGIAPGQYQTFSLSVGPLPDTKTLAFPAIQTYSDGRQVAWIDPTVEGQAEPQHPAPTVQLAASGNGSEAATTRAGTGAAGASGGGGTSGMSIAALAIGAAGLLAGLGALALALSSRRRSTPTTAG